MRQISRVTGAVTKPAIETTAEVSRRTITVATRNPGTRIKTETTIATGALMKVTTMVALSNVSLATEADTTINKITMATAAIRENNSKQRGKTEITNNNGRTKENICRNDRGKRNNNRKNVSNKNETVPSNLKEVKKNIKTIINIIFKLRSCPASYRRIYMGEKYWFDYRKLYFGEKRRVFSCIKIEFSKSVYKALNKTVYI